MALVQFPHSGGRINYPDDRKLFAGVKYVPEQNVIVADYRGSLVLTPWESEMPKEYVYRTRMQSHEFLWLLTPSEVRDLETKAKTDDDVLKLWHVFKSAHDVNLHSPMMQAGLGALVAKSVLTAERRAEIEKGFPEEIR